MHEQLPQGSSHRLKPLVVIGHGFTLGVLLSTNYSNNLSHLAALLAAANEVSQVPQPTTLLSSPDDMAIGFALDNISVSLQTIESMN